MIICWALLGAFLIGYFIENFTSSTAKYLKHFVTLEEVINYFNNYKFIYINIVYADLLKKF